MEQQPRLLTQEELEVQTEENQQRAQHTVAAGEQERLNSPFPADGSVATVGLDEIQTPDTGK